MYGDSNCLKATCLRISVSLDIVQVQYLSGYINKFEKI